MQKVEELTPFIGEILDVFETFLEEHGIEIDNEDKQEAIRSGEDPESLCILYGSDYGELQSDIEEILAKWSLVEQNKLSHLFQGGKEL